jgi:PPM family protein phosphatase
MNTAAAWHSGVATDLGLRRAVNEDRVLADDARGVFLVVDGLGGHAAGETAAEIAVRTIEERLRSLDLESKAQPAIREAITEANNRIYERAQKNSDLKGMACVLTLAVVQDDRITVGHVGDSRLYLAWNGDLKKLTSDHSPVGEQEDQGALTEREAMNHPRRNEVFRDVGSRPHSPDDPEFIETKTVLFRPDAALLLCSDGLSDALTSGEISAILDKYNGAPGDTARQLIEAANQAGGRDNISVVFVPGPEFLGSRSQSLIDARPRHAITRLRGDEAGWRSVLRNALWLLAGMLLATALWAAVERFFPSFAERHNPSTTRSVHAAIVVDAKDSHAIQKALDAALPGDTIDIPAGDYLGPIELKDSVSLIGKAPAQVKLRSDPFTANDAGLAIVARGVTSARVEGLRILADDTHPLRTGVWIADSSVELIDLDISGAADSGIRMDGVSRPALLANFIHANAGPGLIIAGHSAPRLTGNWISDNGKVPNALRAGIQVDGDAHPQLGFNVVARNGLAETLEASPAPEKKK